VAVVSGGGDRSPRSDPAEVGRRGMPDLPTDADHRRQRSARRQARLREARIEAVRDAALLATFRLELSATVRSASPLLISLLAMDGLTLDDAVSLIRPQAGWPRRPRLSGRSSSRAARAYWSRWNVLGRRSTQLSQPPLHQHRFHRADGGYLMVHVVDHSIELIARIGRVYLFTLFGELRIELDDELPEVILSACVGWLIDEVVDHEALRGRGWRIVAVKESYRPLQGQTLVVATGSVPYRMPWAR
jgi:hypothetical protein